MIKKFVLTLSLLVASNTASAHLDSGLLDSGGALYGNYPITGAYTFSPIGVYPNYPGSFFDSYFYGPRCHQPILRRRAFRPRYHYYGW